MSKSIRLRRLADVGHRRDHYISEASLAGRFIDAVERALTRAGRHPHSGSLRFCYDLDIPDLRTLPVGRFPYLIFHVETASQIDVWRVLHARRNLSVAFADDAEE